MGTSFESLAWTLGNRADSVDDSGPHLEGFEVYANGLGTRSGIWTALMKKYCVNLGASKIQPLSGERSISQTV